MNKMLKFDQLYRPSRTPENQILSKRFTQGDYRRFCVMFYLQTRRLLKDAVMIMTLEKKKMMMPRHIMVASVLSGLVPRHLVTCDLTTKEQRILDHILDERKRVKNAEKTVKQNQRVPTGNPRGRPKKTDLAQNQTA